MVAQALGGRGFVTGSSPTKGKPATARPNRWRWRLHPTTMRLFKPTPRPRRLLAPVLLAVLLSVVGGRGEAPIDPDLVRLSATPDRAALVAGVPAQLVVRLRLEAATRAEAADVGLNLGLLLDTSGSMAGEPIEQARAAVHALVDELRPSDRLTLVTFDSRAQIVLAPTTLDDADLEAVHARIDAIVAEGTTDLSTGLSTLLQQLDDAPTVGDLDRIVIVGDGIPNDASAVPGLVDSARRAGFAITTLGVGLDYDEVLLGDIARLSGGRFHHVEDSGCLTETFAAELFGAQRQIAGNVHLQLSTGPGVTISRVVGSTPNMSGQHQYAVVLAELAEGEAQEIFVEIAVDAPKADRTLELLDAIVTFDDRANGSGRIERRAFVAMPVSSDAGLLAMRSPDVEFGAVGARAAAATIEAITMTKAGDLDAADALLLYNERELDGRLNHDNAQDNPNADKLARQGSGIAKLRNELRHYRGPANAPKAPIEANEAWQRATKDANAASVDLLQAH